MFQLYFRSKRVKMAQGGNPPFTFGVDDPNDATMGDTKQSSGCGHGQQGHGCGQQGCGCGGFGCTKNWSHSPIKFNAVENAVDPVTQECLKPAVPLPPLFPTVMKSVPFASEYAEEHQRVLKLNPSMHLPKQQLHDEVILTE